MLCKNLMWVLTKQYWIEKSHEVFKPRRLMEEEKRKVENILKEQGEKERLYNE